MGLGFGLDTIGSIIAGKPDIPAWNAIDLGQQQTKAISENQGSLPALETLAGQTNTFNIDQMQKMLQSVIPGYKDLVSGVTGNIQSMVGGKIPKDVQDAIQSSGAARSLTGGFGGSGLSGNLVARDLGLTSLDLTGKGDSAAQSWISSMAQVNSPGMFNMSSMFVSPQQQFQDTMENQTAQFQRDYASNMNDYQHSLGVAGAQDLSDTMGTISKAAGSIEGSGSTPAEG
jgi:hypothetical protein